MTTTIIKCADTDCQREIDTEDEIFYQGKDDKAYCQPCYDMDIASASTAYVFEAGIAHVYRVGDLFVENEAGESWNPWCTFTRTYKRTDGWRGYYETKVDGWTEILNGWTTGEWGDSTSARKRQFNRWFSGMAEDRAGAFVPGVPLAITFDQTSNVFSTGIGVFVPEEFADDFCAVHAALLEDLAESLR